jgi:hypothetical protein
MHSRGYELRKVTVHEDEAISKSIRTCSLETVLATWLGGPFIYGTYFKHHLVVACP